MDTSTRFIADTFGSHGHLEAFYAVKDVPKSLDLTVNGLAGYSQWSTGYYGELEDLWNDYQAGNVTWHEDF